MGVDSIESNECREGKEGRIYLVEAIKGLEKYIQIYKVDNERLMKAKEKHDGFNVKSMRFFDRI
jgi:hypothetical protein